MAEEATEEAIETLRRRSEEALKKITSGLGTLAKEIEERDVPKLTRNIVVLATGAMMMYTMATAVSTMLPTATVVFSQLGVVLGYMIPIMINIMMFSIMISMVKLMLR